MEANEPTGFITLGPKEKYQCCIQICYTPTPEQIKNMQEMFGWDYLTIEEYERNGR